MAHASGITGSGPVRVAIIAQLPASHSLNDAVTSGRCSACLENVLLKRKLDLRRNLRAEERVGTKRWQTLFSSTSQPRECMLDKARRHVCVSASRLDSAVSTKIDSTGASSTPYLVQDGDTLTSIAKKTRTSVRLLADSNSIENVNFLLSGQLLQIPTSPGEMPSRPAIGTDEFPIARVYDGRPMSQQERTSQGVQALSSRGLLSPISEGSHLAASVQPASSFNFPRLALPILLISPLLGFCMKCIVDALYLLVDREAARDQAERDAWEERHSPKANRWQKKLEEDRDRVETSVLSAEEPTPGNARTGGDTWSEDGNVRENARIPVENTPETITSETDEEIVSRHK